MESFEKVTTQHSFRQQQTCLFFCHVFYIKESNPWVLDTVNDSMTLKDNSRWKPWLSWNKRNKHVYFSVFSCWNVQQWLFPIPSAPGWVYFYKQQFWCPNSYYKVWNPNSDGFQTLNNSTVCKNIDFQT